MPKWGLQNALNGIARFLLAREISRRDLWLKLDDFEIKNGRVSFARQPR
jgi:hypothetical protein